MKIYEIVLLVLLVIGIGFALAFGGKKTSEDASISDSAAVIESAMEKKAEDAKLLQTSALIDYSKSGEYLIAGLTVVNTESSLAIADGSGEEIARFNLDENGKLVPVASQPAGIEIKSAWVGPPSLTDSKFNVYGPSESEDESNVIILALSNEAGNLSIIPGEALIRSNARSYKGSTVGGGIPPQSGQGRGRRRGGGGGGGGEG